MIPPLFWFVLDLLMPLKLWISMDSLHELVTKLKLTTSVTDIIPARLAT